MLPFTTCFSSKYHSDLVFCVFIISCLVSYTQKEEQHILRHYALSVMIKTDKSCKVLRHIYLCPQGFLFGFNNFVSQKFSHLNHSCLPYRPKLHLANVIISSCPSDFHVQSYIWTFKREICVSNEGC